MKTPSLRWKSLDAMKALCVLAMVTFHSIFWLLTFDDQSFISKDILMFQSSTNPFLIILSFVAIFGLLPPMIPMTAGAALRFHLRKWWTAGFSKMNGKYPWNILIKRTFFIVAIGFILNLLAWGLDDLFSWDVLFFIAFSFLLITIISKFLSIYVLMTISIAGILITPYVRKIFLNFDEFYMGVILTGDLMGDHFWPIFPWIFLVIFGFVLAHLYLTLNRKNFQKSLLISGSILIGFAVISGKLLFEMDDLN